MKNWPSASRRIPSRRWIVILFPRASGSWCAATTRSSVRVVEPTPARIIYLSDIIFMEHGTLNFAQLGDWRVAAVFVVLALLLLLWGYHRSPLRGGRRALAFAVKLLA